MRACCTGPSNVGFTARTTSASFALSRSTVSRNRASASRASSGSSSRAIAAASSWKGRRSSDEPTPNFSSTFFTLLSKTVTLARGYATEGRSWKSSKYLCSCA